VNWLIDIPNDSFYCRAKTRYRQTEQEAEVIPLSATTVRVNFEKPQRAITSGQSVVFYDGERVLGGGIID
ncbi:MAG: tRNA 2-thiouridine(34) synthase MnmA, partial [Defluviitaleaceae bacterium]|nr:tRNA 2-thiouridine(34) synthase MnmA [Defluviitaleaceae bacterium]